MDHETKALEDWFKCNQYIINYSYPSDYQPQLLTIVEMEDGEVATYTQFMGQTRKSALKKAKRALCKQ